NAINSLARHAARFLDDDAARRIVGESAELSGEPAGSARGPEQLRGAVDLDGVHERFVQSGQSAHAAAGDALVHDRESAGRRRPVAPRRESYARMGAV